MVMGLGFLFLVIFLIMFQMYRNYRRVGFSLLYQILILIIKFMLNYLCSILIDSQKTALSIYISYSSHLFLLTEEEDPSLPSNGNHRPSGRHWTRAQRKKQAKNDWTLCWTTENSVCVNLCFSWKFCKCLCFTLC